MSRLCCHRCLDVTAASPGTAQFLGYLCKTLKRSQKHLGFCGQFRSGDVGLFPLIGDRCVTRLSLYRARLMRTLSEGRKPATAKETWRVKDGNQVAVSVSFLRVSTQTMGRVGGDPLSYETALAVALVQSPSPSPCRGVHFPHCEWETQGPPPF